MSFVLLYIMIVISTVLMRLSLLWPNLLCIVEDFIALGECVQSTQKDMVLC